MSTREGIDRKAAALVGARVADVAYWDIHHWGDAPREWDHGDWHHAVLGVELRTSAGPVSVVWTSTFYPYGVEVVCSEPMTSLLDLRDDGPESWTVTEHPEWRPRAGTEVLAADTFWERLELGPARDRHGQVVDAARTVEVPVAMRLDLETGPVWFVAGIPTEDGGADLAGDEIMVVFTSEAMLRLGFPAGAFTAVTAR